MPPPTTSLQLDQIKSALIVKGVPSELRGRVMEYYEYQLGSAAALEELSLFDKLPPALSAQLNLSTNRKLAARCAFFKSVSNASLVALISELKACVFIPEQMVICQGLPLRAVYFVNRGIVQLFTHDDSKHSALTNLDNVRTTPLPDANARCPTQQCDLPRARYGPKAGRRA